METSKKNFLKNECGLRAKFGPNYVQCCEKKVKKLTLSIGFSHILHGEYILKQEVVVVQTPEQKFKAIIATNTTFQGNLV